MTNKLIGKLIILAVVVFAILLGGGLGAFVDVPALLMIIGISLGTVVSRHGFKGITQILDEQHNLPALKTMADAAALASIIASLVATVVLLSNMNGLKDIGPSLAVSMLGTFYAFIMFLLCFAFNPKFKINASSALLLMAAVMTSSLFYIAGFIISLFLK